MQQWKSFVYDFVLSVNCGCPFCTNTVLVWTSYIRIRGNLNSTVLIGYPKMGARLRELDLDTDNIEQCLSFLKFVENWFITCVTETECEMKIRSMIATIQLLKEQELAGIRYPVSFSDMEEAFLHFDQCLVNAWRMGLDIHQILGM